jgi:hypothetical protein
VVEGLSRLISEAKSEGFIQGIKITYYVVTTNLFVDDIMLFGHGSLREINFLKALWIVITNLWEWKLIWINIPCSLMVWKRIWKDK